jgi:GT2 family glycosyltransferase
MTATILIPTRGRPGYLDVALASVVPQASAAGAEVIVVDDGADSRTAAVAARHGARLVRSRDSRDASRGPRGANAARNAGIAATSGDPVILIDDDIRAPKGWLDAVLKGVEDEPAYEVFGGPIRAAIDGGPTSCGRESAPITTLDLGSADADAAFVWSANMAIRRSALDRIGPFDESIHGRGEEEDWERRYAAQGGRIRYLGRAAIEHRRIGPDARLPSLCRAAFALGRTARRYDTRKVATPSVAAELRTLAGCLVHVARFRCANMITGAAHALGRLFETFAERRAKATGGSPAGPSAPAAVDDFLSGTSGEVSGIRATSRAVVCDAICDATALARLQPWRLRVHARRWPRRRVLVLAIERTGQANLLAAARRELMQSHHEVAFHTKDVGTAGKFENLDALLERHPAGGHDWLLVLDDDVVLPHGFLDTFVFLAERFDLALAQPAHRWRSHAGWRITRRRPGLVAHETRFVEIGPVSAFHARTFETLLPFPPLRFGWGLELHWSALARERGWREGVIDATPVRHGLRKVASAYTHEDAIAEARRFLASRAYTTAREAQRPVVTHRRWQ